MISKTYKTRQEKKQSTALLFWVAVFGSTQVYLFACLGISEIPILILAPFLFFKDYSILKRDGFMPILNLVFLNMIGCLVGSIYHHAPIMLIIKEGMVLYSFFAFTVVFHRLLRGNFSGLRWYLVGSVISSIITAFAFHPKVSVSTTNSLVMEEKSLEERVTHPLFWMGRLFLVIRTVMCGWYQKVPIIFGYAMVFFYALVLMSVTVSGRSAIALALFGMVLMTLAGKHYSGLIRVRRHILAVILAMGVAGFGIKVGYAQLAKTGVLGEKAMWKYEAQTKMGSGIMNMLRSGRSEFFIGLYAIIDHPLVGYGISAPDTGGYVLDYVQKYMPQEDLEKFMKLGGYSDSSGHYFIPSHSYIIGWWVHHGVFGLLIWLYVLGLVVMYFWKYITAVPSLFPFIAFSVPFLVWDVFFSPYTGRMGAPMMVTCLLFCRAAAKGVIVSDPIDMGLVEKTKR